MHDWQQGIGNDWWYYSGRRDIVSAGVCMAMIRNTGSHALAFERLEITMSGAGLAELVIGATNNSNIATSAGKITARAANFGMPSAAFSGSCYYGVNAANSGLSMSDAYSCCQLRLEEAGTLDFAAARPLVVDGQYTLVVKATPDADGPCTVGAQFRVLTFDTIRT